MLPLHVLAHRRNLDDVRRARHGSRRPARKYNLVAILEVSALPGGLDGLPETVLQGARLIAMDGGYAPHQRKHPDRVLDGAYGQDLVRRPEAGDSDAREPRLGRGQDGLGFQVFGQLAGGVGNGVVAVAASPGGRGGDVAPVVDGALRGAADALHLLHAPLREAPDGRLAREHHRVGPVEDGVGHVGDLGTRRAGVPDHGVEHLRGHDDRFAQAPATGDHALLLDGHPLGGELDGEVPAGHHDAVGGRDDVLNVVYGLVLFDLGDDRRVAAELFYPLLDLPDLVGRAHEGHGHPVGMQLLHPEAQVLHVLGREPPDGERGVGEVQALVGRDGATFQDLADHLAVLYALHAQAYEAVVDEQAIAGGYVVGQVLVGGGEPARVAREVPGGEHHAASLHQLCPVFHVSGPDLRPLHVLQDGDVAARLPGHAADDLGVFQVHAVLAVGEVEPGYVHPGVNQGRYGLLGRSRRA